MRQIHARSGTLILLFCIRAWFFPFQTAYAAPPVSPATDLVQSGGYLVSANGSFNSRFNIHSTFIPASIIKVATSLVALECLGPSYRFKTEFYLNDNGTLFIKGYGDPFLTSEYIRDIAVSLKKLDIKQIKTIVIDTSSYLLPTPADGAAGSENPYDAPNSGLAVNFNSLAVQVNKDGSVLSGEDQTPPLPLTQFIGSTLKPGNHRVNVSGFPSYGGIDNSLRYTGELFAAFLGSAGIVTNRNIRAGSVDDDCRLIYTFTNPKRVLDLVKDCLTFSNNFIANQLFLACGLKMFGYPATWEKGRRAMYQLLADDLGINCSQMEIHEGSGLSRKNKVSPFFMVSVLEMFKPYRHLLPVKNEISLKSGTLTDVYCYAGYFNSSEMAAPFVIMLNQTDNARKEVLISLYQTFLQKPQSKSSTQRKP